MRSASSKQFAHVRVRQGVESLGHLVVLLPRLRCGGPLFLQAATPSRTAPVRTHAGDTVSKRRASTVPIVHACTRPAR